MENKPKLYRIWYSDGNDRSESARILACDFDVVQEFLLKTFIEPESQGEIELTDFGLEWSECDLRECQKIAKEDNPEITEEDLEDICSMCDNPNMKYFEIEELEDFDKSELEFKTIYGTNDFYDLTKDKPIKAEDWSELIAKQNTLEKKISALIIQTIRDKPELEKGFNKKLIQKSLNDIKER